jgi:hypothetical protein
MQLAGIAVTMAIAIAGGVVTGKKDFFVIIKLFPYNLKAEKCSSLSHIFGLEGLSTNDKIC